MNTATQIQIHKVTQSVITDNEVNHIVRLRDSRAQLKKRLNEIEAALEHAEEGVIKLVEAGGLMKTTYPLRVKTSERHFPSWKDAFVSHLGVNAAAKVLAQTEPRIYKTLIITQE